MHMAMILWGRCSKIDICCDGVWHLLLQRWLERETNSLFQPFQFSCSVIVVWLPNGIRYIWIWRSRFFESWYRYFQTMQWIFTNKPNMTSHAERVLKLFRTRESAEDTKQNCLNGVKPDASSDTLRWTWLKGWGSFFTPSGGKLTGSKRLRAVLV